MIEVVAEETDREPGTEAGAGSDAPAPRIRVEGLGDLESLLGYQFRDLALLETALTHPSARQENGEIESNQRLEFLGDAALRLVLSEALYQSFPDKQEGYLSKATSTLAQGGYLSELARRLQIGVFLRLSEQARREDTHASDKALEDAIEAVIGAIFLDSDFGTVASVVRVWLGDLEGYVTEQLASLNPKGRLQELLQGHGREKPEYRHVETIGPPHDRRFIVEVWIEGALVSTGEGNSKKRAEEDAAIGALGKLTPADETSPDADI